MTISSATPRKAGPFLGNGVTDSFPFTFKVFVKANLELIKTSTAGVDAVLVLDTHYSIALNADQDNNPGGTITYPISGAKLATGEKLTGIGALEATQETDITNAGAFLPQVIEDRFDYLTILTQQHEEKLVRAVLAPASDISPDFELATAAVRAGKYVAFDANGNVIASAGTGNDTALRTDLATTTVAVEGARLVGFRRTGTGAVARSVYARLHDTCASAKDFGAVGDGVTNDVVAIQAAIDAVNTLGGGSLVLPAGRYKIASSLAMKAKVNIIGEGYGSVIEAADCDALTFGFTTGFGKVVLQDFAILGTSGTTRRAIYQAGTLNDADELYGITLSRLLITDFNTSVKFRNVRVCTIEDCWLQDTNIGIDLTGKCFNFKIRGNEIVLGDGNGAGDKTGILLDNFNFSGGSGTVGPEGIVIDGNNHIFGFDRCIKAVAGNVVYIAHNDLSGRVYGIEFTTVQNGFSIVDTFIEMSGAGSLAAIKGNGLGSQIAANINIERVSILGSTTTTCVGVQINDAGNSLQNHVNVVRCLIEGMTSFDILMNNPGQSNIENNRCKSTGVTEAIKIGPRQSGIITVTKNHCLGGIEVETADAKAGTVRVFDNIDDGTATKHAEAIGWYEEGTWTPADASGAALALVGAVGTYTKNGNMVTARCQFTYPATADGSLNVLSGLPYNLPAAGESYRQGNVSYTDVGTAAFARPSLNSNQFILRNPAGGQYTNAQLSGITFTLEITYTVA